MKKLALLLLCLLPLSLFAQSAQPIPNAPSPVPAIEPIPNAKPEDASLAKLAQYDRAFPVIAQQRDAATSLAQNLQVQLQLLSADLAAAQKEVADLKAKVAKLEPAPKPSPETKVAAAEPKK